MNSNKPTNNTHNQTQPGSFVNHDLTLLTNEDLHYFNEGTFIRAYEKLGSHLVEKDGESGGYFAVWAPNAESVNVMGDFNGWNKESHSLQPRGGSGVWEGFIPGLRKGTKYKYHIQSRYNHYKVDKADPYAFKHERPPNTASVLWDLDYEWNDEHWMKERHKHNHHKAPISIYEVHLGSWMRADDDVNRFLTYSEVAVKLAEYVKDMGFTHVEFLPVMEHPFYGSWGYQTTGFFAPTSRYGDPQGFMYLVDILHQHGIGVILDWVPSHFPSDEHGPAFFDGTALYEHSDRRLGYHPDWHSYIFNYHRHEISSFLISSAMYWLKEYHVDGLRVDAVASMLYLDYSREPDEWIPNEFGGRENLGAIAFLRKLNEVVYQEHPDVITVAEESTAWPMVSRPTYLGGLGFGFKWDMGWMHDTLTYMSQDPIHRKYHHNALTFRGMYAFTENYILPLSHDEVVHMKGSLLGKMPGDTWRQFANLRLLFAYMCLQPGKKLLFMGGEFAQGREWNHDGQLDWPQLEHPLHKGVKAWTRELNLFYRHEQALHELDTQPEGFEWIDCTDSDNSVILLLRVNSEQNQFIVAAFNFTPIPRTNYRIGVPKKGFWKEMLNSDAKEYGGSGQGNMGGLNSAPFKCHGRPHTLNATLPPLGAVFFKWIQS